jgi:TonB family protein
MTDIAMTRVVCAVIALLGLSLPALAADECAGALRPIMNTHTQPPYPELSVQTEEAGVTLLLIHMTRMGVPDDIKIDTSSGSLRLDEAARDHVLANWRWQPLPDSCKAAGISTKVQITWHLRSSPDDGPQPATIDTTLADYPPAALSKREQGKVAVLLVIASDGTVAMAKVANSSGFPDLDEKSVEIAKTRAKWIPARMNGTAITTTIFVMVVWDPDKLKPLQKH